MDEFWKVAKKYKEYVTNPPAKYLLNFSAYPWELDRKANLVFSKVEIVKNGD